MSLWLEPSEAVRATISEVIGQLAQTHKTAPFAPHITLIGNLQDANMARGVGTALADTVPPFNVRLQRVDVGPERSPHLALYLEAARNETLTQLHATAAEQLGIRPADYAPHLSLMYANLDRSTRWRIAATEVTMKLPIDVVVDRLSLWTTEGPTRQWTEVSRWSLRERRRARSAVT